MRAHTTDRDAAFLDGFATRWLEAWNSHDTDEVLALLSDDIVWDDRTFWPEVISGIAGVRAYVERIWQVMPDVRFDEIGRFFDPDDRRAIVLFRQQGSAPPSVVTGKRFDTHGCDIFLRFGGDHLAHYLSSYDITEMMRQLGMLPARQGRVGGAYHMSLLKGRTA